MGVAAVVSLQKFTEDLKQAYESDLDHIVTNIHAMCRAQQELLQNKLTSDLQVARRIFHRNGHRMVISPERLVEFERKIVTKETTRIRVFLMVGGYRLPETIFVTVQQMVRDLPSSSVSGATGSYGFRQMSCGLTGAGRWNPPAATSEVTRPSQGNVPGAGFRGE
jgi:hypothetical protein